MVLFKYPLLILLCRFVSRVQSKLNGCHCSRSHPLMTLMKLYKTLQATVIQTKTIIIGNNEHTCTHTYVYISSLIELYHNQCYLYVCVTLSCECFYVFMVFTRITIWLFAKDKVTNYLSPINCCYVEATIY